MSDIAPDGRAIGLKQSLKAIRNGEAEKNKNSRGKNIFCGNLCSFGSGSIILRVRNDSTYE